MLSAREASRKDVSGALSLIVSEAGREGAICLGSLMTETKGRRTRASTGRLTGPVTLAVESVGKVIWGKFAVNKIK
jgi:hypothetical protein